MFANMTYARLAAACPDGESRERLDRDLSAPMIGWDAAEQNLMRAIMSAPGPGPGA